MTFNEVGKRPPVFVESTAIAHAILNSGLEFDSAEIIYNRFKSVSLSVNSFFILLPSQECHLIPDNSATVCSSQDSN